MTPDEPDWLAAWRGGRLDPRSALSRFDGLDGVAVDAMLGRWRGVSLPTGHPLDGLLEGLGWWGKSFETPDRVHPLLFRTGSGAPVPLEPSLMPVGLALRMPGLAGSAAMRRAFRAALPVLRTARPAARLEERTFRGKASAAMVYRRLSITDHFRRIDNELVLGLMVLRRASEPYFYFLLSREHIEPE
jgi:hypothetical protein